MDKDQFLKKLTVYLQKMNVGERTKFITYYDEMILDYMENGMSEGEAVSKIGNPKAVAEELLENYDSIRINIPTTGSKMLNIILLVVGFPLWGSILLAIILLILSAYVVIWCIPITTGAGSIGFLATSIVGILGAPFIMFSNTAVGIIQLGIGIAAIGIGLILGMITIQLSSTFVVITKNLNSKLLAMFKKRVVIS